MFVQTFVEENVCNQKRSYKRKNLVGLIDSLSLILVNHQIKPYFKLLPMPKVDSPIYAIVGCRLYSN